MMIRFCRGSGCKRQHLRVSYALCFESCLHHLPTHTSTSTDSWRSGPLSGTEKLTCIGVHVDAGLGKPVRPRAFQSNDYNFVPCACGPATRGMLLNAPNDRIAKLMWQQVHDWCRHTGIEAACCFDHGCREVAGAGCREVAGSACRVVAGAGCREVAAPCCREVAGAACREVSRPCCREVAG